MNTTMNATLPYPLINGPFGDHSLARRLALMTTLLVRLQLHAENGTPFTAAQREALVRLVQTDPQAAKLFRKFQHLADASLADAPQPARSIATAGKLASDPEKQASRRALEDMEKIEALGYTYAVTADAAYGAAARRMILAWAQTYRPTGQPIDETKLEPLFNAYGLTRRAFSSGQRNAVESWLRLIAQRESESSRDGSVTASNNWNSRRLNIIGQIGFLLDDSTLIDRAVSGFKRQVAENLRPDGSSLDFHLRDALYYHCYDLEPLLALAIAAHQHGMELYDYEASNGASLRKSVEFLLPYCDGAATHAEWTASTVAFDRRRAAEGEAGFEAGSLFDPRRGLRTLALASFFDTSLEPVVAQLADRRASAQFPVWQSVLNQALRQ